MRGRLFLAVAVVAVLAAPAVAAQRMCYVNSSGGQSVSYPCGSFDAAATEPEEDPEPWYAGALAQTILAVVGLAGSAGAGGYTYYRVRSRRRTLTGLLASIERTYAAAKSDPGTGAMRLAEVRAEVRAAHDRNRLDDAHFLELDKRATQYLTNLRMLEIEREFATLPPALLAEIRRLVGDGGLSQTEADLIEVRAAAYRIPDAQRARLAGIIRGWAATDAPPAAPEAAA